MPQITMLEHVWNGATLLASGSAVTVSTELADALVGAGKAVDSSGYRDARVDQTMADDVQRAHAAAVVGASMSEQSYVSFLSMIGEDQMDIVSTYTALPTAAANYRRTYWVTDQKTGYLSDGTNWLPLSDRVMHDLGAETPPTMSGTSEVILDQFVIPEGCWKNSQDLMLMISAQKNGTSENVSGRLRIGTLGTLSDTLIIAGTLLAGTTDGSGFFLPIKRLSATSVMKYGSGSFTGSMNGGSTTDVAAAITVENLDSNAVTVTLSALSTAAVEVTSLLHFRATLSQ